MLRAQRYNIFGKQTNILPYLWLLKEKCVTLQSNDIRDIIPIGKMKKLLLTLSAFVWSLSVMAADYDLDSPFGFCTCSSRTEAASTFDMNGGGWYAYPVPDDFTGKVIVLTSDGSDVDMKTVIQDGIKNYDVVILDGSKGDFLVSSSISITSSNKTIIGINHARLCTQWYVTMI